MIDHDILLLALAYVLACAFTDLVHWRRRAEWLQEMAFQASDGWAETIRTMGNARHRSTEARGKERT